MLQNLLLVVHLFVALALIGVVMLQRSEGGGLGMGGGNAMMSVRGAANILTRTTAILAGAFMVTSIVLAIIATRSAEPTEIIQGTPGQAAPAPVAPIEPAAPAVPPPPAPPP